MTQVMNAPNRTYRRTFGNGDEAWTPSQTRDFLKRLCEQVAQLCQAEEYEGRIEWKIVDVSPTSFYADIQYIETIDGEENRLTVYRVIIRKRYYNHNIAQFTNLETDEAVVMEADPRVVMAWLAY